MAIIQNTNITSGSLGNAIFVKRFGKTIMRAKPLVFKDAKTPAQLARRNRFGTLVQLIRQVLPLINQAYAGTLAPKVPFNRVLSLNMKNAFKGDPPALDHTKVVFCEFEGSSVTDIVVYRESDTLLQVRWKPDTQNPRDLAGSLTFILVNTLTLDVRIHYSTSLRSAGSAAVPVPPEWKGARIALHVVTSDSSKPIHGVPRMIIRFAGSVE